MLPTSLDYSYIIMILLLFCYTVKILFYHNVMLLHYCNIMIISYYYVTLLYCYLVIIFVEIKEKSCCNNLTLPYLTLMLTLPYLIIPLLYVVSILLNRLKY